MKDSEKSPVSWAELPESLRKYENDRGIIGWLRFHLDSLTAKLVLLFILAVLPVNLIMVLITGYVTRSYRERMADSYEYQLALYVQSAQAQFDKMNREMRSILNTDNLILLNNGPSTDSTLDVVHFQDELGKSEIWDTYSGIYYIWDHEKDILSFSAESYYSGKTALYSRLEEEIRAEDYVNGKTVDMVTADDRAFLIVQYHYRYYSFGILFDAESILSGFSEIAQTAEEASGTVDSEADGSGADDSAVRLLLTDADGTILAEITGGSFTCGGSGKTSLSEWNSRRNLIISQSLSLGNYRLAEVIPQKVFMKQLPAMIVLLYVFAVLSFLAIPALILVVMHYVVHPLQNMCLGMEEVKAGNLEYQLEGHTGSYQMSYLYFLFNHMIDRLHRLITESYEKEIERLQTDSINMRLQVNQHMLLNFLNTIYSLSSAGKSDQVNEFTLLLMKYFRYVLRQNIALVPVKEEMRFVEDYLQLQKIRFPESYTFSYSVAEEAEEVLIPQLLIENFVENTVKYGLIMGKEIEILINIRLENERLMISVCDTGNGMKEEIAEKLQKGEVYENQTGKHIGVWNCRRRLKYYYGNEYVMNINSRPGEGTQIWIEMPVEPLEKETAAKLTESELRKGVEG